MRGRGELFRRIKNQAGIVSRVVAVQRPATPSQKMPRNNEAFPVLMRDHGYYVQSGVRGAEIFVGKQMEMGIKE